MGKSLSFWVFLVVGGGLGGCQKSEGAPSTSTSAQAVTPAAAGASSPAASVQGLPPSCSLITKAELEATLHETFEPPSESKYVAGICEFRHKGARLASFAVTILPFTTRAQFESEAAREVDMLKTTREPVAGVGEEAFEVGKDQLIVYAHGKAFELSYLLKPIEPSQRDALAKIALGRL